MKLNVFNEVQFLPALKSFFKELNVPINYVADEPTTAQEILQDTYKDNDTFKLINDVYFVGMVDDSSFRGEDSIDTEDIKSDYDGILIFGVTLHQRPNHLLPTRSQLAEITRAFNREFYYTPVTLVFKYKNEEKKYIAFSNSERLKYKQEWREGEKAGKVSLLRDIDIENPHRGHEDIINQLKIQTTGLKAVDSFNKLYKYWQEVFNVSILNKKFYQELQSWYFWAIKEVTFPNAPNRFDFDSDAKFDDAVKEHKGKNVIRLLTRLLFIWFIKEKKLVPEEIFDENYVTNNLIKDFTPQKPHGVFATGKNTSMYYRAILQNLFFATLNQEMGKRQFRIPKKHMNVSNLMRYQNYFKDGGDKVFLDLMNAVPFMNGGLFECLDKPHPEIKGKQGGDIIIYEDGFSDRDDNMIEVPDFLFFDIDEEIDISDDIGLNDRVYKNAKTRGLLEILKSYKFTITENTPIEEDVALDPELLGKVFENLLASYNPETKTTARKQTGSFYTPREIVNYMVDESLIAYLKNTIKKWDSVDVKQIDKDLHTLVAFDNPKNPFENDNELQNQIIKALDNCKILDPACGSGAFPMGILQKMVYILHKVDPSNTEWKHRQLLRVDSAIRSLEEIDDAEFREKSIKELHQQKTDIEEAFKNNELDYGRKLYLIENCIYGVDIQSIATQISKLRFFISLVVDQKLDKTKNNIGVRPLPNLETKFVAANTLIGIEKPDQQGNLFDNEEVKKLEDKLKRIRHKLFSSKSPARKRELREEDKNLRNRIAELLKDNGWRNETARQLASWDPYDQNASSPFFDPEWMYDIATGFNIIIGNPPYVTYKGKERVKISPEEFEYLLRRYKKSAEYKVNSYALFIENGYDNLSNMGCISYIIPSTVLQNEYLKNTRNLILNHLYLEKLVIFQNSVFEATTDSIIVHISKRNDNNQTEVLKKKNLDLNFESNCYENWDNSLWKKSEAFIINLKANTTELFILDKIQDGTFKLGDLLNVYVGIVASGIKRFLSDFKYNNNYKPYILGRDIDNYFLGWKGRYINFLPDELHSNTNEIVYQQPFKILVRKTGNRLMSVIDNNQYYTDQSIYNLYPKKHTDSILVFETINVLLNSKVLDFYFNKRMITNPDVFPYIKGIHLKELPIKLDNKFSNVFSCLSKILQFKRDTIIMDVTNATVFELYFSNHMKNNGINVFEFVEKEINEVIEGRDFEKLTEIEKELLITKLHQKWINPQNEIVKRIAQFKTKSPDILKPILES